VVLALAGLERLGRREGAPLPAASMTPAPGQGCLALEARAGDARVADLAERVTDRAALVRLIAERALTSALEATCRTPIGAHATLGADGDAGVAAGARDDGAALALDTFVGLPDGSAWIRDRVEGDAEAPSELGREAARRLEAAGARDILSAADRVSAHS
jgi:hydroxymethylbilane synthase